MKPSIDFAAALQFEVMGKLSPSIHQLVDNATASIFHSVTSNVRIPIEDTTSKGYVHTLQRTVILPKKQYKFYVNAYNKVFEHSVSKFMINFKTPFNFFEHPISLQMHIFRWINIIPFNRVHRPLKTTMKESIGNANLEVAWNKL